MSFKKSVTFFKLISYQLTVFIGLVTLLEIGAFLFYAIKESPKKALSYHPILQRIWDYSFGRGDVVQAARLGGFSPIIQDRFSPNTYYLNLEVNACGYVSNSSDKVDDCLADLLNKESFKVFMVGGSSMVGHGVDLNEQTIPAILQTMFAAKYPDKDIKIFNFAAGGSYTYRQAQFINSELLRYAPNIIVSFDGFNDAWYWALEPSRSLPLESSASGVASPKPIPNWADYSYRYFLQNKGFKSSLYTGDALFTYLKRLLWDFQSELGSYKAWNLSSEYVISRDLPATVEDGSRYFYNNVASGAMLLGISDRHSCYLQILQGELHHKKHKTQPERQSLEKFVSNWPSYETKMLPMYEGYAKILKADPYGISGLLEGRFVYKDYRDYISNVASTNTVYLDNIHTNYLGNKLLADRIYADIINLPCFAF